VILIDANVLLIDIKYNNDPNFTNNRRALTTLATSSVPLAVPTQVVLEVVGVLSFGTPAADVPKIWPTIQSKYGLRIVPDSATAPEHCGCTFDEIVAQMVHKMAAGDAVIAAQVAKYAAGANVFLTWNLKHFRGNLAVPVLTPDEWLQQQNPPTAPSPPAGPTP
jgi:hypothetical protein